MLRCPEPHEENVLVMSTGEMLGRMVRSGIIGCPVCHREYPIVKGVVHFSGGEGTPLRDKNTQSLRGVPSPPSSLPPRAVDAQTLQALLDLSGPGGYEGAGRDRKSTRLNSSHLVISYAVFCLKKKKAHSTSRS